MRLKTVSASNRRGDILDISVENPTGLIIRNIEGLGPVKASLVSSKIAGGDGETYHSGRRETRNLIFDLALAPDMATMSVYDLRMELYKYFMPKSPVDLTFKLFDRLTPNVLEQNLEVKIEGYVESLEPNMFTKDPSVKVSVICHQPDFKALDEIIFGGASTADLTETALTYNGTTEVGFLFQLLVDRTISEVTIYARAPDNTLSSATITVPMVLGDILEVSSVLGDKYVVLDKGGYVEPVLYGQSPQSKWLKLYPGVNNFRVYVEGNPVPFDITYREAYGGL